MQKYVEAATSGMEKVTAAEHANEEFARAGQKLVEELDKGLQEFMKYQAQSYKTMEQVRRLLTDISAAGTGDVRLTGGKNAQRESLDELKELLENQGEQQQILLEEITRNFRELTKSAQKGKFGIFR